MTKSTFDEAYGSVVETLVEARKKAGLTQVELAERIGKRQNYVSVIENGHRRIDILEFYAIALAMGASPVELFAEIVQKLPNKVTI